MKTLFKLICFLPFLSLAQPTYDGMYFDGVDDNFTVPNTTNINSTTTNDRTYETYFKVVNTGPRQIIMKEGGGTRAVIIYIEGGYLIVGAYNRADYTPRWDGTYYRYAISADTWYHTALVFDNAQSANATTNPMNATANNALKFYVNGALEADNSGYQLGRHNSIRLGYKNEALRFPTCGTWSAALGSAEYCFGTQANDGGGNEYYFEGNLWGFRVWNDVRTPAEINDNMDVIIDTIGTDDLVAYIDGDTLTYLDSSDTPQDVDNSNPSSPIIWSATAGSKDWNTASNWDGGKVPSSVKLEEAVIQLSTNYPEISSHIVVGDLEVQPGAEITIQDGGTLDIGYDVDNSGTITIENNGSLLNRESKPVSGTGDYVINRDSPNYPDDDYFSIWSTPIVESDSRIGDIFTNNIIAYEYNALSNPAAYSQVGVNDNMEVGRGYFIRSDNESGVIKRTFTGTVNNGDVDISIYFNSATDNFNLIGNPYPSAMDWLAFQEDNSSVLQGTMYFWSQSFVGPNNSAADYISFNNTGPNIPGITGDIATAAGVFTKSNQAGTVTFKNTHRLVGNNSQFFRVSSSNNTDDGKSWFKLQGPNGFSSILIGFLPEATDAYEDAYDGEFVNEGSAVEFYSFIGLDKYSIQGRSELQDNTNKEIPLGFEVATAGTYTISKSQEYIDSNFDILLDDTQENILTDLRLTDYTFNLSSPTEGNDRFILRYNYRSTLNVEESEVTNNNIKVFFNGNDLVSIISGLTTPDTIEVYDISGKKIASLAYNNIIKLNNLSSGMYLIKYNFKDANPLTKRVLKS